MAFKQYVAYRDEATLFPVRIPLPAMSRINPFPATLARLKRMGSKPVRAPDPFEPTVQKVADVVPPMPFRPARSSSAPDTGL